MLQRDNHMKQENTFSTFGNQAKFSSLKLTYALHLWEDAVNKSLVCTDWAVEPHLTLPLIFREGCQETLWQAALGQEASVRVRVREKFKEL